MWARHSCLASQPSTPKPLVNGLEDRNGIQQQSPHCPNVNPRIGCVPISFPRIHDPAETTTQNAGRSIDMINFRRLYIAVLVNLALLIAIFYAFTKAFE